MRDAKPKPEAAPPEIGTAEPERRLVA